METITLKIKESLGALSDEQFFRFWAENRDLRLERTAEQEIQIMIPAGGNTGYQNIFISSQLWLSNQSHPLGYTFDSSTGFKLTNGAIRSPDSSWIKKSPWEAFNEAQRATFPPLCPDFVIALSSPNDSQEILKINMQVWMIQGGNLAKLLDPIERQGIQYQINELKPTLVSFSYTLVGDPLLPGLLLDLSQLP